MEEVGEIMGDPLPPPMVNSTTGAMNSLLHKLTAMEEAHGGSFFPRENLEGINDVFRDLGRQRLRGVRVKEWMLQAREVTYDIEDWVDGSLSGLGQGAEANFWCSDAAEQVEEFMDEIQDVQDRCKRYNLIAPTKEENDPCSSDDAGIADDAAPAPSSKVTVDATRMLYGEAPCLLGTDEQRDKIVNILMAKGQHRKVVSVVGTGGIGKSALAKEIYRHLQGQFECGAFVSLGRNPCVKTVVISILNQAYPIRRRQYIGSLDEEKITHELWRFLKTRSYFVVLDDVWSVWTWNRISCVLPNNVYGEGAHRILITTCFKNVAESCCIHPSDVVHHMEGLGMDDSKKLLDSKIFVPETISQREASKEFLQICGGIPLAITVTTGLLPWNTPCLLPKSQGIRKILDMSYGVLPLPLKSCFLYLSAFPENNAIKKDRLIRRWIAEGFVPKSNEETLWDIGESYFDELISRRLIQPTFDDREDDQPIGCIVHRVVHDFIVSLSTRENFIATGGAELNSQVFPCGWIRRLCLHCTDEGSSSDKDHADNWSALDLSRVRSLAFSGKARRTPDVGALKLLRVLDLEDTKGLEYTQLKSIGHLTLLRYLGLAGTDVTKLPEQIIALAQLTTLDLRRTTVDKFLLESRNTELVSVLADELVIRQGMLALTKLEKLSNVLVGFPGSRADDLTQLVKQARGLRMLGVKFVHFSDHNEQGVKHFLEEVGKSNLQSFLLHDYNCDLLHLLIDWNQKKPRYLRKFEDTRLLVISSTGDCFPRVPHSHAY